VTGLSLKLGLGQLRPFENASWMWMGTKNQEYEDCNVWLKTATSAYSEENLQLFRTCARGLDMLRPSTLAAICMPCALT
jgi:hypothetical protein